MSIASAAVSVLTTAPARAKAITSQRLAADWAGGRLIHRFDTVPPDRPARPKRPQLLTPSAMPKRGKGGSRARRVALLHALAHIELNAIDLAWDLIARFGAELPREFVDDWTRVGADEGRHFLMLDDRLQSLGADYGALPAHDGLWKSAMATAHALDARLAVVPMVLEARGLDVSPSMIERLSAQGDIESADILSVIYEDEIRHVRAGSRWFEYICARSGLEPVAHFRTLVQNNFPGRLKPPFNQSARKKAGLDADFYEPLVGI